MQVLSPRCVGLDVHKKTVVACVMLDFAFGSGAETPSDLLDHDSRARAPFLIGLTPLGLPMSPSKVPESIGDPCSMCWRRDRRFC
jgi:hypothetical protein